MTSRADHAAKGSEGPISTPVCPPRRRPPPLLGASTSSQKPADSCLHARRPPPTGRPLDAAPAADVLGHHRRSPGACSVADIPGCPHRSPGSRAASVALLRAGRPRSPQVHPTSQTTNDGPDLAPSAATTTRSPTSAPTSIHLQPKPPSPPTETPTATLHAQQATPQLPRPARRPSGC
jgi:hypothetical protein